MTDAITLAKHGLCEFCKKPTQHGPWTDEQISAVIADLGGTLEEFGDHCDDCFVDQVGQGQVAFAESLLRRPLTLTKPEYLEQQRQQKFLAGGQALKDFRDKHGDAARQMPESIPLFEEFLKYAPPEVLKAFEEKAKECNLLPEAKYVNEAGETVFSPEQIAEKLGIPVEQVENELREKFSSHVVTGRVHQIQ